MLAVREDKTHFYRFRMSERDRTRVVSQLVEAGAALDMQDKVTRSNIIHYFIYLAYLNETDITMVVIAISALD